MFTRVYGHFNVIRVTVFLMLPVNAFHRLLPHNMVQILGITRVYISWDISILSAWCLNLKHMVPGLKKSNQKPLR